MLRLQLALLVEIVEGVADDLGKSDDRDEVRYDHDSVEEVRELPYEVELQRGTEDYEEHRYASEYRERLVAEEVLHVLLGEEVPADDRRVSEEEDADCDERRAEASESGREGLLRKSASARYAVERSGREDDEAVIVMIMNVVMNTPMMATNPCSAGCWTFACAWACGVEPIPASFAKSPRATP